MKVIFYPELEDFLREKCGIAKWDGSKKELIIRCPFEGCLDNTQPKSHGHLYVFSREPIFNCYKCGFKGSLTKLIKYLGGDPKEFLPKEVLSDDFYKYTYKRHKNFGITKHIVKEPEVDKYKLKVQYLKGRLGFDYPIQKIPGLVLNVKDFIFDNKIQLNDSQQKLLEYYENSFVGFVTTRGTKLMLRNISTGDNYIEHAKIDLQPEGAFFKDFFGVRTGGISKEINTIVLAEGIFDILLALEHYELLDLRNSSCFWAAVIGNYYEKSIVSVLDICKLTRANIVILSDSEKKLEDYKWVPWNPSVNKLEVIYNKYGHDFGKLPINISRGEHVGEKWR